MIENDKQWSEKHRQWKPDLTVVTLTLNEPERLEQTCRSVRLQTGCAIEHLVINGGRALELDQVEQASDATRVINSPPEGIYAAMNLGLAQAKGQAIMFIHSGDRFFRPNSAARATGLVKHSEWGFGSMVSIRRSGQWLRRGGVFSQTAMALGLTYVPHPSTIMRTTLLRDLGGFDPKVGLAADQLAILQAAHHWTPARTRAVLTVHLEDGQSADRDPDIIEAEYRMIRRQLEWIVLGNRHLQDGAARLVTIARKSHRRGDQELGTLISHSVSSDD